MAKARGDIYRRWQLARLPYVAEIPIPGTGLGSRLGAMHAWARAHCGQDGYAVSSRPDRTDPMVPAEVLQVRFADEATAEAFAAAFGATYKGRAAGQ